MSRTTLADQVVLLAHAARQALHQYKFRRAGIQRDIVTVDPDAAVHRVRLQQVSARQKSGPRLPVHVRRVPHTGVPDRAQRILHGKSPHLPKDGEMIEIPPDDDPPAIHVRARPRSQSAPETSPPSDLPRETRSCEGVFIFPATRDTVCTVLISTMLSPCLEPWQ